MPNWKQNNQVLLQCILLCPQRDFPLWHHGVLLVLLLFLSAQLSPRLSSNCLSKNVQSTLWVERPLQSSGEEGLTAEMSSQREVSIAGETLEDMSLSSNSSLDKNDTSQEYMDDFDNLGKTTLI